MVIYLTGLQGIPTNLNGMEKNELEAKQLIMETAMQLVREHGDISKITIRDISARANVGVSLVNYHFQTKENLINQCVKKIIGKVISGFDSWQEIQRTTAAKPLRHICCCCGKYTERKSRKRN